MQLVDYWRHRFTAQRWRLVFMASYQLVRSASWRTKQFVWSAKLNVSSFCRIQIHTTCMNSNDDWPKREMRQFILPVWILIIISRSTVFILPVGIFIVDWLISFAPIWMGRKALTPLIEQSLLYIILNKRRPCLAFWKQATCADFLCFGRIGKSRATDKGCHSNCFCALAYFCPSEYIMSSSKVANKVQKTGSIG